MPPRQRRRVLRELGATRFLSGLQLIQLSPIDNTPWWWGGARPDVEGIKVDVVRPDDLVHLSCTFVGCELVGGGAGAPTIRPTDDSEGLLVADLAFQHAHEEAIYETVPTTNYVANPQRDDGDAPQVPDPHQATLATAGGTSAPVAQFRPARGSRLVFRMLGEPVEFSTEGILAAMKRLPLNLHPKGEPPGLAPSVSGDRPFRIIPVLVGDNPVLHLGDGLVAELRDTGPVIMNAPKGWLRSNRPPDLGTAAGITEVNRNLARLRAAGRGATPVVVAGTQLPEGSILAPGNGWTRPDIVIEPIRYRLDDLSERPAVDQTSIEAPFRLVLSPTSEARFTHATGPVRAEDAAGHVELWHTRLANAPTAEGGEPDEDDAAHRVVRAVWTRDRDYASGWESHDEYAATYPLNHPADPGSAEPFLGSLDGLDRHMLVRQTSETWVANRKGVEPRPVGAEALWMSSLGAWLRLHGEWDSKPYSAGQLQSILAWDHVAPMGRDQYVRVVYPGYLYPFGHLCALVKVTERKLKTTSPSYAGLYQRMFLVVGQRTRTYGERRLPYGQVSVRPLVTPPIDFPTATTFPGTSVTSGISTLFWPQVGGTDFVWTLETSDKDAQPGKLHTPLLWVNEAYNGPTKDPAVDGIYLADPRRVVDAFGQNVAFVPKTKDLPDARLETQRIYLRGAARLGGSDPTLTAAQVVLPAVQRLSPTDPLAIRYRDPYVSGGLGGAGDVWAEVIEGAGGQTGAADPTSKPTALAFGGAGSGSDKAGGFLAPNLPIRALSVNTGPVGDVASAVSGKLDPEQFLAGAFPKLFGLIDLIDLLEDAGAIPDVVSDTLGRAAQFVKDVERLARTVEDAVHEAAQLVTRAQDKSAALSAQAADALAKSELAADRIGDLVDAAHALVAGGPDSDADLLARANALKAAAEPALDAIEDVVDLLPPLVRDTLRRNAATVETLARDAAGLLAVLQQVRDLVESQELTFHFDWKPRLQNWPEDFPIFTLDPSDSDHLVLSVDGRVSAAGDSKVSVAAELRDFSLTLFGTDPLMRVPFDHMSFKAGSSGKPEIDVVLGDIEFLGLLSFVETIKELIPFDGFSDPPYMEVSPEGAKAGFTLALPSLAIGVFNLSNMSLGADVSIPFLGKSVTVGFNFCTRERPFTLTVMCLGGGGWFLIRVAPDGLDILEVGLEATACLSVDLGVASGSISAAIGLYIRLEGEKGSLTGYFRLRGEVDVLGLISASIELYMELIYRFDTGKMIGRATITVEVEVFIFSGTVKISAERQFAGSNGDPSFREILGAESGTSQHWTDYASAFAAETV
jgi:hypothetical protein